MGKRTIRKVGISPSRRQVIASGTKLAMGGLAIGGSSLLGGCARRQSSGSSSHAGRRARSEVSATALEFDIKDGFAKLNRIRRKNWLPDFQMDQRLQRAAQDYANLMGARGLYGHEIGPGTDFKTRIFAVGFNNSAGENIGVGYGSIEEALQGWMDSSAHRKNMLKARYNLAGLAYGFNTSGRNPRFTHYWVLIMGRG